MQVVRVPWVDAVGADLKRGGKATVESIGTFSSVQSSDGLLVMFRPAPELSAAMNEGGATTDGLSMSLAARQNTEVTDLGTFTVRARTNFRGVPGPDRLSNMGSLPKTYHLFFTPTLAFLASIG